MLGPTQLSPLQLSLLLREFSGFYFFFTNQNTIKKQDSKRSFHLFPTAFSPTKHKQNASLWINNRNQQTKWAKRSEERKQKEKTDLGDFCGGDPYNDNSSNQEQTSPILPTHNESNKTHNEKLKKQPKIYVGSLRSQRSVIFPLIRGLRFCGILGGSLNQCPVNKQKEKHREKNAKRLEKKERERR